MEIYSGGGVLKTGTLRVTQSIGAIGIMMGQGLGACTNEVITIYIERSRGENEYIADKVPLSSVLTTSTFGTGKLLDYDGETTALVELSEHGSINLEDNERIVIILDGLKSTIEYAIHGIQYPTISNDLVSFDRKIMLANELKRTFNVENVDELSIIGTCEKVVLTYDTTSGREVIEHTQKEIDFLCQDMGGYNIALAGLDGPEYAWSNKVISLVGVERIEVHSSNQIELVLRSA